MKKIVGVIILLLLLLVGSAYCLEPEYDPVKGYGWSKEVPKSKPEYPNAIIKEWVVYNTREIFVDVGKDGTCDIVYVFTTNGAKTEDGQMLYWLDGTMTCDQAEKQIETFLRITEGRENS